MNEWLIFVVMSQLCVVIAMWVMYWYRKEHKMIKILEDREVKGCCKLQRIMLNYEDYSLAV